MTITFSSIWIPIAISLVLFVFGVMNLNGSSDTWLGDTGSYFLGVVLIFGILLTWTSYYTMLYFLK